MAEWGSPGTAAGGFNTATDARIAATIARVMGDTRISEASYRVVIDPTPDTTTPTGYAWSTGKGPNTQIAGGTGITVAVEVDQQRPISKVLPIIRGAIGG